MESGSSEIGVNLELLLQVLDVFQNLKLLLAYKDIDLHSTAILAGCDSWWNLAATETFYSYQKNTIKIGCANLQNESAFEAFLVYQLIFTSILGFLQSTQQSEKFQTHLYWISQCIHNNCMI